jgi:hypothetical protein
LAARAQPAFSFQLTGSCNKRNKRQKRHEPTRGRRRRQDKSLPEQAAHRSPHKEETMKSSAQTKPSIVFCHGLWADGSAILVPDVIRTAARAVQQKSAAA